MKECLYCKYKEYVKATVKSCKKRVAICVECDGVYEFDENDIIYPDRAKAKELHGLFKTWKELDDIVPFE